MNSEKENEINCIESQVDNINLAFSQLNSAKLPVRFNKNICNVCMSYMQLHLEKVGWLKCPSCGFCKGDK